jgi:hypothetical protein
MPLGLSSAAAPDAMLEDLFEAAARRGLGALELREGDAHGVGAEWGTSSIGRARQWAASAGVTICGFLALGPGHDLSLARLSNALGAPVLLGGPGGLAGRLARASAIQAIGAVAAVVLRGDSAAEDAERAAAAGLMLAWEADPRMRALGDIAESLLERYPGRLRHVRLLGGGPEAAAQEGRGLGGLMRKLALAGYDGTLVLAPSAPRHLALWRNWLGRGGGWGCGSRTGQASSVHRSAVTKGENQ